MALSIPESFNDAILSIACLETAVAGKFADALVIATPTLSIPSLLIELEKQIGKRLENGTSILELLLALHRIKIDLNVDRAEFLVDVFDCVSLMLDNSEAQTGQPNILNNFRNHFEKLLKSNSVLETCAKAIKLFNENSVNFQDASLISDIRPVFKTENSISIKAALISHKIKLSFFEDGRRDELFISVSREDLAHLQNMIDKATTQDTLLRKHLKETRIPLLEPDMH